MVNLNNTLPKLGKVRVIYVSEKPEWDGFKMDLMKIIQAALAEFRECEFRKHGRVLIRFTELSIATKHL